MGAKKFVQINVVCPCCALASAMTWLQWRSQDIAIARAQHGHTTFVRTSTRSAEAYRGIWGRPPAENLEISQPPRSVLRPYTVVKCKSLTANSCMMSV